MKDTTKRSPTADPGSSSSRRKEKHVSRACNGCRRRKSKCDGVQPVCGTCAAQKHECSWTTEEDGRRPATKAQVDAMSMEIRTLKDERDRQHAQIDRLRDRLRALGHDPDATPPHAAAPLSITIPPTLGHGRALSEGGGQYLGIPSPISFGSASHSPLSVASSLPSAAASPSQFLTVPGFGPSRGPSPEPSVYGSSTDDDEPRSASAMSDSDNDGPMAPFVATRKRLFTFSDAGGDDDVIALTGSSPLALSCSPPRTPARSRASSFRSDAPPPSSGPLSAFRFPPSPALSAAPPPPTTSPTDTLSPHPAEPEHDALCPCDWARHLPQRVRSRLGQAEHDALLADYFAHVAAWGLRVVPRLFLRDMRAALSTPSSPRTAHYSPALHNAVLADAAALAPPGSALSEPALRDALAAAARDAAEEECAAHAAIPAVTALAVLAQYHLARERRARLAFAVLGMAVRAALSAGLNIDARDVVADDRARWDREWCYWSLFVQDVDMSLHVGQELTMPAPRTDVRSLALSPALAAPAGESAAHLVGETFVHTCALMALAAQIMQLLARTDPPPASGVSALQTDLARWHADLPDALQIHRASTSSAPPHVLVMHMALNWITILLHRPFYAGSAAREESRKFLDDACTKLLRTLGTFERLYTFRAAPLALVQIAFVGGAAALLRAEGLHAGANKKRSEAIALAHQARDALRAMGAAWPCAAGYADALDSRAGVVASHVHSRTSSSAGVGSPVRAPHAHASSSSGSSMPILSPGGGHAHSHSVPAVVVQDANNGAPAPVVPLVDSLFNPFGGPGGDMWAYAPFGVPAPLPHEDPMLGVHPGLLNPDAGAGAALFAAPSPDAALFAQGTGTHDVFMHGQGQEQSPGGVLFGPGQGQGTEHDPFLQQQQDPHDVFLQQHNPQQPWPWPHQGQQPQ